MLWLHTVPSHEVYDIVLRTFVYRIFLAFFFFFVNKVKLIKKLPNLTHNSITVEDKLSFIGIVHPTNEHYDKTYNKGLFRSLIVNTRSLLASMVP